MTETPPPAPKQSAGGASSPNDDEHFAARQGQHGSPHPEAPGPGTGHARQEMAGSSGYPQAEGPGAAHYGSEPPPPPGGAPHPSYGPPGTGPGWNPAGPAPVQEPVYGYQQVPTGPSTLDVGQALSYGLAAFRANPGPWVGVTAVGLVIYLGFLLVVQLTDPTTMLPLLFIFLAVMAGIWLLQAAMVRGALYETDGTPPPFGAYFRFVNAGNVLLTALLAFLLTFLGSAICLLPGLIAGWLCMFSLHFVVDQDQGPFEALKSSFTLVVSNAWQVLLLALAVLVVTFLGLLLCGFGLLVAGPVATIAVTYAYRTLTGGTVAAR
ncbi:hypothetical protein IU486_27415 [Streptomyces gardneri]|uniref:hypothetical protein n=1 Tax=Nocardia TaxID=1817 RepID=UPI001893D8EB|nr:MULTISPECIES: hypothetical protein [Nocardia]MBF6168453.1 hypothetical protein [Streptomyces gardneri]MBF6207716.1 hypothetical protein [Streptomyces gardneri]UAK30180.1 hypothetical protein K8O92_19755 [Nocardia asteroides]